MGLINQSRKGSRTSQYSIWKVIIIVHSHILLSHCVVFPCESKLKLTLLYLWGELNAPLLSKGRMPARSKVKWKKKKHQQQQKNATSVFHACRRWSGQMLITLTVVCTFNISVPPPSPSPKSVNPSSDYEARQHHHWITRGMEDVPIYLSSIIGDCQAVS